MPHEDEAWRWNDVGKISREDMAVLGAELKMRCDGHARAWVVYEPGDMTRYEVVFTSVVFGVTATPEGTIGQRNAERKYLASVVNFGSAYWLGGGWKAPDYVREHWLCDGRPIAGASVLALANLFNAFEGQL